MSRSLKYIFPAANESDVCLQQTTMGVGNLILNGNLSNSINSEVSFISRGYSRAISITSANNLDAVNFTINGIQNGVVITENIRGPDNTTVYSTLAYDIITSISVDGNADAVSVGTGLNGSFSLIGINLETNTLNYNLSISTLDENNINVSIWATLDDIFQNGSTFLQITNNYKSIQKVDAINNAPLFVLGIGEIIVWKYLLVLITIPDGAAGVQMNFIQI